MSLFGFDRGLFRQLLACPWVGLDSVEENYFTQLSDAIQAIDIYILVTRLYQLTSCLIMDRVEAVE